VKEKIVINGLGVFALIESWQWVPIPLAFSCSSALTRSTVE